MEGKEEPQPVSARGESQTLTTDEEQEETKKMNKLSFTMNAPVRAKLADYIKKPAEAGGAAGVTKQRTVVRGRQVVTKVAEQNNEGTATTNTAETKNNGNAVSSDLSSLIENSQQPMPEQVNPRQSVRMPMMDDLMSGGINEKEGDLLNNIMGFEDIPQQMLLRQSNRVTVRDEEQKGISEFTDDDILAGMMGEVKQEKPQENIMVESQKKIPEQVIVVNEQLSKPSKVDEKQDILVASTTKEILEPPKIDVQVPEISQPDHQQIYKPQEEVQPVTILQPEVIEETKQVELQPQPSFTPFEDSDEDQDNKELIKLRTKVQAITTITAAKTQPILTQIQVQEEEVKQEVQQEVQQEVKQEVKEEDPPSNLFVDGPQIIGRDSGSDSDKAIKVRNSVKVDSSHLPDQEEEPEFNLRSRISQNYVRQTVIFNQQHEQQEEALDLLAQMEQLELTLDDPFAMLRENSPKREQSKNNNPIIPQMADQEQNNDLENQIMQAEARNQDVLKKRLNRIADNSADVVNLIANASNNEEDVLFKRAANVKPPVGNNRRLTLKDINMLMPEENSSLESEEDRENYLENLLEQEKLTKLNQEVKEKIHQASQQRATEVGGGDFLNEIDNFEDKVRIMPVQKPVEVEKIMETIDWNERKYQEDAKVQLKQNSILGKAASKGKHQIRTRIVSNFQSLASITSKLMKEHQLTQARSTCVGISESLVFVGNSEGQLQLFDRDNEQYYTTFSEKSKDFVGNSVTAIDVHPLRPEYVILGYANGQLVLLDVVKSPQKSLKVIKDASRNVPIINARFADWAGPQGKLYSMVNRKTKKEEVTQQDENQLSWMVISIDADGYVYITTVVKIMIVYKVTRCLVVDPMKSNYDQFSSMATRFQSPIHGQGLYDNQAIVAMANRDTLVLFEAKQNDHKVFGTLRKPQKYYNKSSGNFDPFLPLCVPALTWGQGMSPLLKDRPHSMLAVGWGPVIQIAVLIDHEQMEKPIILDGYHIIRCFDLEAMSIPRDQLQSGEIFNEVQEISEVPDEFEAFKQLNACYIEAMFFLSDSTLLVLLSGHEMRILDTQNFRPEAYDPERIVAQKQSRLSIKRESVQISGQNNVSLYPDELEIGIRCARVLKSECGKYSNNFPMYQQTLKYFGGKFVGMTTKGIQGCSHLTWQQSIYDFQITQVRNSQAILESDNTMTDDEEDLTQVFLRALELYKGRIKGYQGLIDNEYLRENFLRAELKLFVKEIIQQIVEDVSKSASKITSTLIESGINVANNHLEQEKQIKFRKIVRIAIEFCVELKDCDFLFKDLCWLFQDYGDKDFERVFIKELEVFILAGKFSEWQFPADVVDNYIGHYYISQDLIAQSPELFQQVIVNLNLNQCSKDQILHFIKYSEKHFLTTAIIFLYTQLFDRKDNASCVSVLFSLYDLYKRASEDQKESTSKLDLQSLKQLIGESEEKSKIERSAIYLGYKLFWLIRLFLHGKKFPQGNIKESKWRSYVHDIVQFLSNPQILKDLATIDAENLFQVIDILFLKNSKTYELVLQGRDDYQETNYNIRFQAHWDFLKDMDVCFTQNNKEDEQVPGISQYVIFVASQVSKDRELSQGLTPRFFFNASLQLLKHYQVYLDYNRAQMNLPKKSQELANNEILNRVTILKDDLLTLDEDSKQSTEEVKYVQNTENDILNVIRKSEPLSQEQISELLELSERIPIFESIQLFLLEKKEDYVKCLKILISEAERAKWAMGGGHISQTVRDITKLPIATQFMLMSANEAQEKKGEQTLKWLSSKLSILESRFISDPSTQNELKLSQLKQEALSNLQKLLQMSRTETVYLIENRFDGNHQHVIQLLRNENYEQLLYLESWVETQSMKINEAIRNMGISGYNSSSNAQAKGYLEMMKLRLRLCCQINPEKVFSLVEKMVQSRSNVYPIEECLEICKEYKQIESCFLLNKKLGKYYEAVTQGLQIIQQKIQLKKLKVELYFAKKSNLNLNYPLESTQLPECYFFDAIFKRIFKILSKHGKEVEVQHEEKVWYLVIDGLLDLKSAHEIAHKVYCRRFFQQRLNMLVETMSRTLSFNKFLDHTVNRYHDTQFKEFQEIILHVVQNQNSEENVLTNANTANFKVNTLLFENFTYSVKFGLPMRSNICHLCKKYLDRSIENKDEDEDEKEIEEAVNDDDSDPMNDEKVKVFACKHTFHFQCLRRHQKKMSPQTNLGELYLKVGCNSLKCPICNITSFDIETSNSQSRKVMIRNRANMQYQEETQTPEDKDMEDYIKKQEKKMMMRATMRENNAQYHQMKHLEKLKSRMDMFQGHNVGEVLTLTDFHNQSKAIAHASSKYVSRQEVQLSQQALVQQQGDREEEQQEENSIVNPMIEEFRKPKKANKTAKAVASLFKR